MCFVILEANFHQIVCHQRSTQIKKNSWGQCDTHGVNVISVSMLATLTMSSRPVTVSNGPLWTNDIAGLFHNCSNSIASAQELPQSCTKPLA